MGFKAFACLQCFAVWAFSNVSTRLNKAGVHLMATHKNRDAHTHGHNHNPQLHNAPPSHTHKHNRAYLASPFNLGTSLSKLFNKVSSVAFNDSMVSSPDINRNSLSAPDSSRVPARAFHHEADCKVQTRSTDLRNIINPRLRPRAVKTNPGRAIALIDTASNNEWSTLM